MPAGKEPFFNLFLRDVFDLAANKTVLHTNTQTISITKGGIKAILDDKLSHILSLKQILLSF